MSSHIEANKKIDWDSLRIYNSPSRESKKRNSCYFESEEDWYEYHQSDIKRIYNLLKSRKDKHFLANINEDNVKDLCYVFSSRKKI